MANFLFNGVSLPALPEWDKETYPYAYMYHGSGGDFFAIAKRRSEPWVDGEGVNVVAFYDLVLYKVSGSAWVFLSNRDSMMHALKETDIFWTNTDLYNTDGTLYLAASDPIPILAPTIEPLSMWMGWKAGNWVARQRGKAKPPVAYLYNGVSLPALPEWDRGVYPYVYIDCNTGGDGRYRAWFLSEKMHSGAFGIKTYPEGTICMFFRLVDGVWEFEETDSEGGWPSIDVPLDPIWTNYDYLDYNPYSDEPDGTVLLAASTPVPVYE